MQSKNIIISRNIKNKVKRLEFFLKDINIYKFAKINQYEQSAISNLNKLKKETNKKINKLLKQEIINYSPIVKVKKELGFKVCLTNKDNWCSKKANIKRVFIDNIPKYVYSI